MTRVPPECACVRERACIGLMTQVSDGNVFPSSYFREGAGEGTQLPSRKDLPKALRVTKIMVLPTRIFTQVSFHTAPLLIDIMFYLVAYEFCVALRALHSGITVRSRKRYTRSARVRSHTRISPLPLLIHSSAARAKSCSSPALPCSLAAGCSR